MIKKKEVSGILLLKESEANQVSVIKRRPNRRQELRTANTAILRLHDESATYQRDAFKEV